MFEIIYFSLEKYINIFSIYDQIDLIERCLERAEIVLLSQEINTCELCSLNNSCCENCACNYCHEWKCCSRRCEK